MPLDLELKRATRGAGEPKLAQRVAAEIERDIVEGVRRVGESLGTEHELVTRHGVSRSVLREALTLVSWSGLAEMRRGKTGGLVVTALSEATTAWGLHSYLDFVIRDMAELLALRREVEELAVALAAQRVGAAELADFEALAAAYDRAPNVRTRLAVSSDILHRIAVASHNPLVSLLHAALSGLTVERSYRRGPPPEEAILRAEAIAGLRRDMLQGVLGAAPGRALGACARTFDIIAEIAMAPPSGRAAWHEDQKDALQVMGVSVTSRLAEKVAQKIRGRMVDDGLGAGAHLGSEVELMAAYGVSRGVVREAIRILERLSVVVMVRGKGGGLRALAPDARPIVRRTCAYLRAVGVRQHHLEEAAVALGLAAAETAAADPGAAERLTALLPRLAEIKGGGMGDLARTYFDLLRTLTDGGAIGVMVDVLGELYGQDGDARGRVAVVKGVVVDRVADLAEALRAGRPALARRRMALVQRSGAVVRFPAAP